MFDRAGIWPPPIGYGNNCEGICSHTFDLRAVLAFFLHNFIGPCEENGRPEECHVNKNLPLNVFWVFMFDVDERFEKMIAGETDQRGCKFNLDGTWADVGQPVWSISI